MNRPLTLLALAAAAAGAAPAAAESPLVLHARLDDQAINPTTARFIAKAIRQAEEQGAECLVLTLDTPGGLVDSTRDIVKAILGSRVPVVVHVAPPGARAASAGVFVTMAAHVAAMAPGTNIGAAHPVQVGGLPGSPPGEGEDGSVMGEKVVNDTAAWARALAELRGRDADWAEKAVRESESLAASAALEAGVIDLLASDTAELLRKIDGREVELATGKVRLETAGAVVRPVEMWWGEEVLAVLSNPTVAFVLLMLGFYGLLFELYSPGWGVAGTLGVVCLVLAFFALSVLPVNYAGLALVGVALALFVAEAFVTSFGALTVAGIVCLILGGTMLVESPEGFQRVSLGVLIPMAVGTGLIAVFLLKSALRAHRGRVLTGGPELPGTPAEADTDFAAVERPPGAGPGYYTGTVRVGGELWTGVSPEPVRAGQRLVVEGREGLTLRVRPAEKSRAG